MRVVVFGAGYFGRNYIRELAGHVVGVVEPDEGRARYARNTFNVLVYPELPEDLKFDGAVVVTPPDQHVCVTKPLVEAGKLVLVEKPMAVSVEEAMVLAKYKAQIMSGLIYLYHPEVERLKQTLASLPIGHICTRRTNDGPVRSWQDCAWDLAAHDIAICNYLLGQSPIGVSGLGDKDWRFIRLSYIACDAAIYVSWIGGPKVRLVELVPAQGGDRVVFDDMAKTMEVSPMRRMLDDFLNGKWPDKVSYDAGLDVVSTLENLERSMYA